MPLSINTWTSQYSLLRAMNTLSVNQATTFNRLSTGKAINSGKDDPAGLIAVSMFNHEIAGVDAGLSNANRADAMLSVADAAVGEISSLLTSISGLVVASANTAGLSDAERAANQLQIDSAIDAIDRLVGSTTFNGQRLLDGSQAINATVDPAVADKISDLQVHSRPSTVTNDSVTVEVVTAATQASTSASGWVDMSGTNATTSAETTLTISGKLGSTTVTIASGSDRDDVINAINDATSLTGVEATTSGAGGIALASQDFGSAGYVSVSVLGGDQDFVSGGTVAKTTGTDAVVTVNGASAGADGQYISYTGNGYSMNFTLTDDTTGARTINISGGGATFQLGSNVGSQATIGISSMLSSLLGEAGTGYLHQLKSGGAHDLNTDVAGAANIVSKAASQVSLARGRIGGFQKYQIQPTINSLGKAKEGLMSARSSIEDADMALETANANRYSLLYNTATSMLGIVNSQASSLLSLLKPLL